MPTKDNVGDFFFSPTYNRHFTAVEYLKNKVIKKEESRVFP